MTPAQYRTITRRQSLYRNRFNKARTEYLNNRNFNDPTTATNAERAAKDLIRVSEEAFEVFEVDGYPDTWHDQERDREDAQVLLRYHF